MRYVSSWGTVGATFNLSVSHPALEENMTDAFPDNPLAAGFLKAECVKAVKPKFTRYFLVDLVVFIVLSVVSSHLNHFKPYLKEKFSYPASSPLCHAGVHPGVGQHLYALHRRVCVFPESVCDFLFPPAARPPSSSPR